MNRLMLVALLAVGFWSGTLFAQNGKKQAEKLREIITEAEGFVAFGLPQMIKQNEMFADKVEVFFSDPTVQGSFKFFRTSFENVPNLQTKIMEALRAKCGANPEGISFANLCKDTEFDTLVGCEFSFPDEKQPDITWLLVKDKSGYLHKVRLTAFTLRDVFKLYCFAAFNELKAADDVDLLVDLVFLARAFGLPDEAKNILDNNIDVMARNKNFTAEQTQKIVHLKDYVAEKDGVRSGQIPPDMVKIGDFSIDKNEYTDHARRAYRDPMVNVSWFEAQLLCERQGKRLCTGTEWVEACRGPENNIWPYGKTVDPAVCSTGKYVTKGIEKLFQPAPLAKAGSLPKCVTPTGLFDMSGNVWEWTTGKNPEAPKPNERLAFGGSNFSSPENAKCIDKAPYDMNARFLTVGFRCCYGKPKLGVYEGVGPNGAKLEAKPVEKAPAPSVEKNEERIEAGAPDNPDKKPAEEKVNKTPVEKMPEKK